MACPEGKSIFTNPKQSSGYWENKENILQFLSTFKEKQHYEDIPQAFSNVETYQYRDLEKEKLCKEHEILLIVIPYWWDNKLDSLKTFLYSKINL